MLVVIGYPLAAARAVEAFGARAVGAALLVVGLASFAASLRRRVPGLGLGLRGLPLALAALAFATGDVRFLQLVPAAIQAMLCGVSFSARCAVAARSSSRLRCARALRAGLHRAVLPQGQRRLRRAVRRAGGRARRARAGGAGEHLGARCKLPRLGTDGRRHVRRVRGAQGLVPALRARPPRPHAPQIAAAREHRAGPALARLDPPEARRAGHAAALGRGGSTPPASARGAPRRQSRRPELALVQPKRPSSRRSSPASSKRRNSAASGQGCAPAAPRPARSKSKPGPAPSQSSSRPRP